MISEKELFNILVEYYASSIRTNEAIRDTLSSVKEEGMDKEDAAAINKAAKLYATDKWESEKRKFHLLEEKYSELSEEA